MKWRDILKLLRDAGFTPLRKGKTSHQIWHHPETGTKVTVNPKHLNRQLSPKTEGRLLAAIEEASGC